MELVTKQIRKELNANWANNLECEGAMDFKPVVKYFMPFGAGKWLITEMDDDEERWMMMVMVMMMMMMMMEMMDADGA